MALAILVGLGALVRSQQAEIRRYLKIERM
jgi:uncharacterized protein DUF6893